MQNDLVISGAVGEKKKNRQRRHYACRWECNGWKCSAVPLGRHLSHAHPRRITRLPRESCGWECSAVPLGRHLSHAHPRRVTRLPRESGGRAPSTISHVVSDRVANFVSTRVKQANHAEPGE
jgi:hypothetical protein